MLYPKEMQFKGIGEIALPALALEGSLNICAVETREQVKERVRRNAVHGSTRQGKQIKVVAFGMFFVAFLAFRLLCALCTAH